MPPVSDMTNDRLDTLLHPLGLVETHVPVRGRDSDDVGDGRGAVLSCDVAKQRDDDLVEAVFGRLRGIEVCVVADPLGRIVGS